MPELMEKILKVESMEPLLAKIETHIKGQGLELVGMRKDLAESVKEGVFKTSIEILKQELRMWLGEQIKGLRVEVMNDMGDKVGREEFRERMLVAVHKRDFDRVNQYVMEMREEMGRV